MTDEEIIEKTEEAYIVELEQAVQVAILQTVTKINKSALHYMLDQKNWIAHKHTSEAEKFFLEKIPKVMTDEISLAIMQAIGLKK